MVFVSKCHPTIDMLTQKDLQKLELSDLMELLSDFTADYTHSVNTQETNVDFSAYRKDIRVIQDEIDLRKSMDGVNITTAPEFTA